jgi:hypothetical protein
MILSTSEVLQEWALLKIQKGEPDRAKTLADLQTAIARTEYEAEKPRHFSLAVLKDALTFQAYLYQKLGLSAEAKAFLQEAGALPTLPPCNGICDDAKIERIE